MFMTMKSEKLANMRTVEDYLKKKSREKVLSILHRRMSDQRTKADNLRKAHKFRLFRYTELMKTFAFNGLKEYY